MTNFETILCCDVPMQLVRERTQMNMGARSATIEVQRFRCNECGDILYSPEQMDAAQRALATELRSQEKLLAPEQIRQIRQRRGLTQVQFEQLLGVGPKTAVRWERGTVFQSRAIDELIRMIDAVPGAYEFLARKNGIAVPAATSVTRPEMESTVRFPLPSVDEGERRGKKVIHIAEFARCKQDKSVRLDEPEINLLPTIPTEALK